MGQELPAVDIVTVHYNGARFLKDYFSSLGQLEYPKEKLRLLFVDNASRDGSLDTVRTLQCAFPVDIIANPRNYGFAKANNMAFARCSAEYIALLNVDTKVEKDWLARLIARIQSDAAIGMVSSRQVPVESPRPIDAATGQTSWCSGGHCVIRRRALEQVGYFDEKFFMYGEDVDLSWRMWLRGYTCVYAAEAVCSHHFDDEPYYPLRRIFFHVRSSLLIVYAYGTGKEIRRALVRWLKEAGSLLLKRGKPGQGLAAAAALIGHVFLIPHFWQRRQAQRQKGFQPIKDKWIHL